MRGKRACLLAVLAAAMSCSGSGGPRSSRDLVGSVSRGSVNVQIRDVAGSNLSATHIPADEVTTLFHDTTVNATSLYAAGVQSDDGGSITRWSLTIDLIGEPMEGLVYRVGSAIMSSVPGTALVVMQDGPAAW